jgi:hypothetical protein
MVPRSPTTVDDLPAGARTPRKGTARPVEAGTAPIYDELVREHGSDPLTGAPAWPDGEQPAAADAGSDGA